MRKMKKTGTWSGSFNDAFSIQTTASDGRMRNDW
jgi:hypothetical protein